MEKTKIGLPRSLFFYDEGTFLKEFLEELNYEVITSPETNKEIYALGELVSNDEMCTSLKIFMGHIMWLQTKCDYIIVITNNNTGLNNQGCTNYLAIKELIKNKTNLNIININIDQINYKTIYKECLKIFKDKNIKDVKNAYLKARVKSSKEKKDNIIKNTNKLYDEKKKMLIAGHSYNIHDSYLTTEIVNYLKKENYQIIYSDMFDTEKTITASKKYTTNLYWKENKKYIGAIALSDQLVNGIITISTFPCNNDLLVNEFIKNKVKSPILNIVVDDLNSITGIITRLESFIDING
ncbi:MAG: acyl-CoA dehydratase activase-related protein [Bacilli bacterium]